MGKDTILILKEICQDIGILVDDINDSFLEYIPDSLTFIQFVVALEERFDILVPDEFLVENNSLTLIDLASEIETWIHTQHS